MEKIKVSVIIPTYKRADLLQRAINSVLNQSYRNIEIVVVDDNSPNSEWRNITEDYMNKYKNEPRVTYVKHSENCNGAVARNTGIKVAKGEIITFLDDDDIYYKDKILKQVNYLVNHPDKTAVYCGWYRNGSFSPNLEGDLSYYLLSGDQIIYTNAIMLWKEVAVKLGGWDETFIRHQEAAFLLRFFNNGNIIGAIPECLVEFDLSDRSNVANPILNEKYMNHYLSTYYENIRRCEAKKIGSERKIYTHRYVGVMLNYIKAKQYRNAIKVYYKWAKKYPIGMPIAIISYIYERIVRN